MFSSFRYWSLSRITFVIFYLALNLGFLFCSWKVFTIPSIPIDAIVLKKDTGTNENGIPKYFIEAYDVKDSTNHFREEISYGFVWDTIDVKEKITVNKIQLTAWIFGLIAFFLIFPIGFFARDFNKLVLRLR